MRKEKDDETRRDKDLELFYSYPGEAADNPEGGDKGNAGGWQDIAEDTDEENKDAADDQDYTEGGWCRAPLVMLHYFLIVLMIGFVFIGIYNYLTDAREYFVSYEYSYGQGEMTGSGRTTISFSGGRVTTRNVRDFLRSAEAEIIKSSFSELANNPHKDFNLCILYYQEVKKPLLDWIFS